MPYTIRIVQAAEVDEDFARQASRLASQLRGEPAVVTAAWLRELLAFPKTWLIAAQLENDTEPDAEDSDAENGAQEKMAGMLTLSAFPRLSGWTAWIEGVVVEERLRGQGIGRALLQKAVALAAEQGFETVNLSSRPHREAANRLYESLGFEVVPTNYRRKKMKTPPLL